MLWRHNPDPQFVADIRRGSPRSRYVAVDLALIDGERRELDMATGVDTFTERAHHGRTDIPRTAQRNRAILLGIMTAAGWDNDRYEWWHYQLFDSRRYPLLTDSAAGTGMM